jgi:hypothetical protein
MGQSTNLVPSQGGESQPLIGACAQELRVFGTRLRRLRVDVLSCLNNSYQQLARVPDAPFEHARLYCARDE